MSDASEFFDDPELVSRRVSVAREDVAWLRWTLEAHEGLAIFHASGDGTLTVAAPRSQARELDTLLRDLAEEIPIEALTPGR